MVAVSVPGDVEDLLSEGREHELLGEPEADWLDFKGTPYHLDSPEQQFELAKDIATLASLDVSGCIVIGIRTVKSQVDFEDRADKISPFPRDRLDEKRYRDIIESFVYPPPRGLRIRIFERNGNCLAMIVVPAQDDDDKLFMLKRLIDGGGRQIEAFAIPRRDGSHTRWTPIGIVHRDIADARRLRKITSERISREQLPAREADFVDRVPTRVGELEAYMGWEDATTYAVAAGPLNTVDRIPGFFDEQGVKGPFSRPMGIRHAGFGIGYPQEPRIERGALVAVDGDFRIRWLDPDGFFIVALTTNEHILGRTRRQPLPEPRPLKMNLIALVEFTYEVCRFQRQILMPRIQGDWQIAVCFIGAKTRPWRPTFGGPHDFADELHPASADDWLKVIRCGSDAETDAYQLLARAFDLFGVSEQQIPYTTDGRVDPTKIRAVT